uniref:Uncharacterized protein n=1 Tax=Oryza brachyantha TaxID=4533 RepID=J3MGT8_ORYBR
MLILNDKLLVSPSIDLTLTTWTYMLRNILPQQKHLLNVCIFDILGYGNYSLPRERVVRASTSFSVSVKSKNAEFAAYLHMSTTRDHREHQFWTTV